MSRSVLVVRQSAVASTLFALLFGCPSGISGGKVDDVTWASLGRFESNAEFDDYVEELRQARTRESMRPRPFSCADARGSGGAPQSDSAAESTAATGDDSGGTGQSITNNQEQGVDEGDIVKASGDFLVILRRGRLFTVRHTDSESPVLTPVSRIDVPPAGYTEGTWYDEMLIEGDTIIVIGYTYQGSATEIMRFKLGADGQLTHEGLWFMSSNDYYSSRNYASRLVGGKLVLYTPIGNWLDANARDSGLNTRTVNLPSISKWTGNNTRTRWEPIAKKTDVYHPVQATSNPMMHTVVTCDLGGGDLACTARAVLGPWARTFYVSTEAVYLWVSGGWNEDEERQEPDAFLYRLPLGDGEVTAVKARGQPIDQFSFKEGDDGFVNVLVMGAGGGDWMANPENSTGDALYLVRAPLDRFAATPELLDVGMVTSLPGPSRWSLQNRFVGSHLIYGAGNGWWYGDSTERRAWVVDVRNPSAVQELQLTHSADRIEAMGVNAVIIGSAGADLHFSSVQLGNAPAVSDVFVREDATQGETRSHGFFFRPEATGGGVIGLPVRLEGEGYSHLFYGSAEVSFLRVAADLSLTGLGALVADAQERPDDGCTVSCVDWYGNARPIFYGGRIIALMGYELVEGAIVGAAIGESARVDFGR